MKSTIIIPLILIIFLVGCSSPPPASTATASSSATVTPSVTAQPPTLAPSATAVPPISTATPTAAPSATPTITLTPTFDVGMLTSPKESGAYMVSTEIAPGVWCPQRPNPECFWFAYFPGLESFKMGSGRGCIAIPQVSRLVEWTKDCGPMDYLHPDSYMTPVEAFPLSEEALKAPHGPGEYLVGVHLAQGVWRIEGPVQCQWTLFDAESRSVEENVGRSGTLNLIPPVHWVRIGNQCTGITFLHN